mgnify:CR=1 FL=1
MLDKLLDFIGSLRLTVVLLTFAMVLVFVGTLAQVNHGIYAVQKQYFQSLLVFWGPAGAGWKIPILPGGYLLGALLLINLAVSQATRFEFKRDNLGLYVVHGGVALLLVGQLFTDKMQVESYMRLEEGQSAYYSESSRVMELAFIEDSNPAHDTVVSVPEAQLARQKEIVHASLPFRVRVTRYHANSELANRRADAAEPPPATQGFGVSLGLVAKPPTAKTDERNLPSAVIEILEGDRSLGTWLVSAVLREAQAFQAAGRSWKVALRPMRFYKPYSIQLLDFTHEKYPGTEIPKNFSSKVKVHHPGTKEEREVLIYMNNPLRFGGETYYQSGYEGDRVTVLQVVRNPAWLTPYIACLLVGFGLLAHFLISLTSFVRDAAKRRAA